MIAAALLAATALPFVVMHVDVNAYGVPGTGTIIVDRASGHFVRRFAAGPASEQEGWDGTHAWRADATGMARVEENVGERAEIVAWSAALVGSIDASRHRVRIAGSSDHIDVAFESYRRVDGLSVPGRIVASSAQNGAWTAIVRGADTPARMPSSTFAPPTPPPSDASLARLTRIPVSMDVGSPVLDVTVNGNRLHFLLDTGGQNVITTDAARIAGFAVVGHGIVSGGGNGTAPIRYGFADTVRVGAAVMRHQPFIVLPANALPPVDGIVGYELLARFAARLNMAHLTLELAPNGAAFGRPVAPARFAYDDRQPQVAGALDATHGAFTIDTGSSLTAQVPEPVVRAQHLIARLHATVSAYANDVGGRYRIYITRADVLRLGSAAFERPLVDLLTKPDQSHPTTIANVGDGILRRWILVFDYPHQTIDFRPGGDPAGNVVHDRWGLILTAQAGGIAVAQVLTGTPGARAGITEGARIVAADGAPVTGNDLARLRTMLRGAPGTKVTLQLAGGSLRVITLERYL
jgi:hypothetical protein